MRWSLLIRQYLRRLPPGSGNFTLDLEKFLPGNRLTFLATGAEVFRSMWEAIDAARSTIHLETYILASDRTGGELARRLMAKARQGVHVCVIFDSVGSLDADPDFLAGLEAAGVSLLEYHPVAPWRPRWAWTRRDHRKILVVDGRVGFTGGVNICDDHVPREQGGAGWNDAHLRVEGPAARELDRLFREVWFKETRRLLSLEEHTGPFPGRAMVWVAANQEFLHRQRIRRGYLNALRAARREVCIANAYFLPDHGIRRSLVAAARRGVAVSVLVPGCTDHPAVWRAGRRTYDRLLRNGVRLFEWPGSILHAKTAVIDGLWCAVGSYNMDHRSLRHNLEVNVHILDRALASRMRARFAEDLKSSRELTLAAWRARPWTDKAAERFWHLFRHFF